MRLERLETKNAENEKWNWKMRTEIAIDHLTVSNC